MRKTIPKRLRKTRKHVRALRKTSALDVLFPLIRQRLLRTTLRHPDRWAYLSELARELRTTASSLQRELHALVSAGIFEQRRDMTKIYFRARRASPIFNELTRMFIKTGGVATKVRRKMDAAKAALEDDSSQAKDRERKHPGVNARKRGTPLGRGLAVQIMCYARARTKLILMKAARMTGESLSSFLIRAAVEKAAALKREKKLHKATSRLPHADSPIRNHTVPICRSTMGRTSLKPKRLMKVMIYPRPRLKAILVEAARRLDLSLSSFIILSALARAALLRKCNVNDLIPANELAQYR